jgi:uncharacterized phage protein (TIGR01671 family)
MTRKIKFRAKIVMDIEPFAMKKGHWVEGYYYEDLQDGEWSSWIQECNDIRHYKVDKDTLGQFTGLFDKNGKEIYEGDIVSFDNHLQGISQVVYDYAGFEVISKNYRTALRPMMNNHIRVIGNIHDNQELMEGCAE